VQNFRIAIQSLGMSVHKYAVVQTSFLNNYIFKYLTEQLQFRNLLVLTMPVESKWFALGCALCVPIDKLERLGDKYHDNPMKALVRVYRYWLADKNGLQPTWEKLLIALQKINEYKLAISLARTQLVSYRTDHETLHYESDN